MSLENPAYSSATISAYSDVCGTVCFSHSLYSLKTCIALKKIENNASLSKMKSCHKIYSKTLFLNYLFVVSPFFIFFPGRKLLPFKVLFSYESICQRTAGYIE